MFVAVPVLSPCKDSRVKQAEAKRTAEEELTMYMGVQQVSSQDDPLMWWKEHENEYPRLARMAKEDLAVPATSASVERLFSSAGLVKSDIRGSLLDATTVDIMWAKHNPS